MRGLIHKKFSIYIKMLGLLVFATILSCTAFLLLDHMSDYTIDYIFDMSNYTDVRNKKLISELQEYISAEGIQSRDTARLSQWVQKQKLLSVSIFKDGIQVFDSEHPDQEIWDEEIGFVNYDWRSYDTIIFPDGEAEIEIIGAYRYQVYSMLRIIELGISFLFFLSVVLLGIRRKMAYIRLLSKEVEILESGNLCCQITIKGRDEISMLAAGLESMRCSFVESCKKEEDIIRRNQKMITEMSHDLRTPVTSIILYAEILRQGKCSNTDQQKAYIDKILQKALLVKHRSDRLLEYSLKTEENVLAALETGFFADILYDPLSEMISFLKHRGFQVDENIRWLNIQIFYYMDYVLRIMDNIASNIIKYADVKKPIGVRVEERPGFAGLLFENHILHEDIPEESNGIGLQSVRNMMQEMKGECLIYNTDQLFGIRILFAVSGQS